MEKNFVVCRYKNMWAVTDSEKKGVISMHPDKVEAMRKGVFLALKNRSFITVLRDDGSIQEKSNFKYITSSRNIY